MTESQEWYQQVYLKSIRWKALRAWRMKKDGYQCVRCGSPEDLHVHHKTYDNRGHDFDLEFHDCETLCEECHEKEHEGEPWHIKLGINQKGWHTND